MREEDDFSRAAPGLTAERYERELADRHLVHGALARWAQLKPQAIALIQADTGQQADWASFEESAAAFALELIHLGFRPGDYLAVSLPLLIELVFLEYACFKIGVVPAPLDLRLPAADVIRSLRLIRAKGYVFPGPSPAADFAELGRAVRKHCGFIHHFIQVSPPGDAIEGAQPFQAFAAHARALAAEYRPIQGSGFESGKGQRLPPDNPLPAPSLRAAHDQSASQVHRDHPALVIFTTGSTGSPKPALLSHRNITCQNAALTESFRFSENSRVLVNLPPSHVGCQTELLMSTLFAGGTAILLSMFDPARSLRAIEEHRVSFLGQIPAMFNLEWRLKDFGKYDLSGLQFVAYGGNSVPPEFVEKLASMAPDVATGLGLTETAGFCTYVMRDSANARDIFAGLGRGVPAYPMSIRKPIGDDGSAGEELPQGEIGHVCFSGPQTFLGYVNDPEATAKAVSTDGFLYTGDLGYRDAAGLHLSGRAKWVMKPFGYQVFPGDIENHICRLREKVSACGVVGLEHPVISEEIVAFVEKKPGAELTLQELERHARALAVYMRPHHYVLLEAGQLPLNRLVKTDYMRLQQMARENAARIRDSRPRISRNGIRQRDRIKGKGNPQGAGSLLPSGHRGHD